MLSGTSFPEASDTMKLILDRFENSFAIFRDANGKYYSTPRSAVPDGTRIGEEFYFSLDRKPADASADRRIAYAILEEIVGGDKS